MTPKELQTRVQRLFESDPMGELVDEFIAAGVTEQQLTGALSMLVLIPEPWKLQVHNCFRDHRTIG